DQARRGPEPATAPARARGPGSGGGRRRRHRQPRRRSRARAVGGRVHGRGRAARRRGGAASRAPAGARRGSGRRRASARSAGLARPARGDTVVPFIGLTGGIGAGKSTALSALERLGAATLSTDAVVHELYDSDELRDAVAARW